MLRSETQNFPLAATLLVSELVLGFFLASIVKTLAEHLAVFQILLFRYLLSLPILILWARLALGKEFMRITNKPIMALRSICGFLGLMMWFIAVSHIDLSLATALGNTMPMFITIFVVLMGQELVGPRRAIAVAVGFVGVFILLFPISVDFNWVGTLSALAGALFAALMFIFIRLLGKTDAAVTTAIWYNSFGALASALLCLVFGSFDMRFGAETADYNLMPWLLGLGLMASFQQYALAQSHYYADASALAPLHYLTIPIGVGFGVLLFDEALTSKFVIGTAIILGANIYIFLRERKYEQAE